MNSTYTTREEWLVAAVKALAPIFAAQGHELPAVRVSVGFAGGPRKKSTVIGQCWHPSTTSDGIGQVFVSPILDDAVRVLDVLAHELVHAINHVQGHSGHGKEFAAIAKPLGLTGRMTATVAGPSLEAELVLIAENLGAYPHAALSATSESEDQPKKQGTRMLKVECPESGYTVRMTRKWIDEYGTPVCPCHGEVMAEAVPA
ncbi:SprT-like protease [Microbacterium phage IAmGroot]|uniref:SprT-like protease n=1 Tax=Microbacterium phage IAmGroot TaxID=2588486 RepID=A0A4Y6E8P9_9CAUD|nr:SprT-like protease [Microbacterium phage IAmGroot]